MPAKIQTIEHVRKRIESRRQNGTLKHTEETKRKMSLSQRGKINSVGSNFKRSDSLKRFYSNSENREMLSRARKLQWQKGFAGSTGHHWKLPIETRIRQGERQRGEKNHMWDNNATERNWGKRFTNNYKIWRESILKKDSRQCVECGSRKRLEVDHIKPISLYPELAHELKNGRTLCHSCHMKTDTYAGRIHKLKLAII